MCLYLTRAHQDRTSGIPYLFVPSRYMAEPYWQSGLAKTIAKAPIGRLCSILGHECQNRALIRLQSPSMSYKLRQYCDTYVALSTFKNSASMRGEKLLSSGPARRRERSSASARRL